MKIIKVKNYEEMSAEAFKVVLEVVKGNPSAVLGWGITWVRMGANCSM